MAYALCITIEICGPSLHRLEAILAPSRTPVVGVLAVGLIVTDGKHVAQSTALFGLLGGKQGDLGLTNLLGHHGTHVDDTVIIVHIVREVGIGDIALVAFEDIIKSWSN